MTAWTRIENELPTWTAIEAVSAGTWNALENLPHAAAAIGSSAALGSSSGVIAKYATASGTVVSSGVAGSLVPQRSAAAVGVTSSAGSAGPSVPVRLATIGAAVSTSAGAADALVPLRLVAVAGSSATLGFATPLRVRRAALPPDAVLAVTNLPASPVVNVQDDPDAADTLALVAVVGGATATSIRLGFPTPAGDLIVGAGRQELRVLVAAR